MSVNPFDGRTEMTAAELNAWIAAGSPETFIPRAEESPPAWKTSEKGLLSRVADFARDHGWRGYHTWKSANSAPGFPDLCLCRVGGDGVARLVFAELKLESGRVTPDQRRWLDDLSQVPGVEVYLWRPADWDEIERILA